MNIKDFDDFRAKYRDLNVLGVRSFYERLHREYPDQKHFNADSFLRFLDVVPAGSSVFEFGGADGGLAWLGLNTGGKRIECWDNWELCGWTPALSHKGYRLIVPGGFVWDCCSHYAGYDVAVFSHSLEHVSMDQAMKMLVRLRSGPKFVYIDYPDRPPGGWTGTCAHVNEMSGDDVKTAMLDLKFNVMFTSRTSEPSEVMVFAR